MGRGRGGCSNRLTESSEREEKAAGEVRPRKCDTPSSLYGRVCVEILRLSLCEGEPFVTVTLNHSRWIWVSGTWMPTVSEWTMDDGWWRMRCVRLSSATWVWTQPDRLIVSSVLEYFAFFFLLTMTAIYKGMSESVCQVSHKKIHRNPQENSQE